MNFDLVIANGTVIDGTGRPRFQANLGLQNGRVAAIATGEPLTGQQTLNAAGLIVAPGFIDVHSHSDWILPLPDHAPAADCHLPTTAGDVLCPHPRRAAVAAP